jgi:hypothetical protein
MAAMVSAETDERRDDHALTRDAANKPKSGLEHRAPCHPERGLRRATAACYERVGMVTCCLEFQGNTA